MIIHRYIFLIWNCFPFSKITQCLSVTHMMHNAYSALEWFQHLPMVMGQLFTAHLCCPRTDGQETCSRIQDYLYPVFIQRQCVVILSLKISTTQVNSVFSLWGMVTSSPRALLPRVAPAVCVCPHRRCLQYLQALEKQTCHNKNLTFPSTCYFIFINKIR